MNQHEKYINRKWNEKSTISYLLRVKYEFDYYIIAVQFHVSRKN